MKNISILIVDDDKNILEGAEKILLKSDFSNLKTAASGAQAQGMIEQESFDLVLLDLRLPDAEGMEILKKIKNEKPTTEVIIITGFATISSAVEAIKLGAYDYLPKPFTAEELRTKVQNAVKNIDLKRKSIYSRELDKPAEADFVIGKSKKIQELYKLVRKVAPTDSTVLIYGETGSGKELVAREIYRLSPRANKPYLTVDCGALVETLLESELFGHIKGSFTGATNTKHGSFELASEGTFFFDEVANLSLNMQAKLLRVLQEKEIRPIGGAKSIKIDVRIICATNKELKKSVEGGTFREDLFYRISVVPIYVPPLRERREDIIILAEHFLHKFSQKRRKNIKKISPEALSILEKHNYPGNVRELQNIIERVVIIEDTDAILVGSLPNYLFSQPKDEKEGEGKVLRDMEKEQIIKMLKKHFWHREKVAQELGIDRKTLYRKIKDYGLSS